MIHQTYRHHGCGKGGGIGSVLLGSVLLGIGGFCVFYAIGWFRSSHEAAEAIREEDGEVLSVASVVPTILDSSTSLLFTDGSSAGMIYRRGTNEACNFNATLLLPALSEGNSYEVWLVQDGLADVKSEGALMPRADGSFVTTFELNYPLVYPKIVIMLEPNDGVTTPSGNIIAQGSF